MMSQEIISVKNMEAADPAGEAVNSVSEVMLASEGNGGADNSGADNSGAGNGGADNSGADSDLDWEEEFDREEAEAAAHPLPDYMQEQREQLWEEEEAACAAQMAKWAAEVKKPSPKAATAPKAPVSVQVNSDLTFQGWEWVKTLLTTKKSVLSKYKVFKDANSVDREMMKTLRERTVDLYEKVNDGLYGKLAAHAYDGGSMGDAALRNQQISFANQKLKEGLAKIFSHSKQKELCQKWVSKATETIQKAASPVVAKPKDEVAEVMAQLAPKQSPKPSPAADERSKGFERMEEMKAETAEKRVCTRICMFFKQTDAELIKRHPQGKAACPHGNRCRYGHCLEGSWGVLVPKACPFKDRCNKKDQRANPCECSHLKEDGTWESSAEVVDRLKAIGVLKREFPVKCDTPAQTQRQAKPLTDIDSQRRAAAAIKTDSQRKQKPAAKSQGSDRRGPAIAVGTKTWGKPPATFDQGIATLGAVKPEPLTIAVQEDTPFIEEEDPGGKRPPAASPQSSPPPSTQAEAKEDIDEETGEIFSGTSNPSGKPWKFLETYTPPPPPPVKQAEPLVRVAGTFEHKVVEQRQQASAGIPITCTKEQAVELLAMLSSRGMSPAGIQFQIMPSN